MASRTIANDPKTDRYHGAERALEESTRSPKGPTRLGLLGRKADRCPLLDPLPPRRSVLGSDPARDPASSVASASTGAASAMDEAADGAACIDVEPRCGASAR